MNKMNIKDKLEELNYITDAAVSEDAYIDTASGDAYNAAIDAYNAAIDAYDAARKYRDTAYAAIDSAKEAMNKVR